MTKSFSHFLSFKLLFSCGRVGWEMYPWLPSASWDFDEGHYMGWKIGEVCRLLGNCLMGQGQLCCRLLLPLWPNRLAQEQKIQPVSSLQMTDGMCRSSIWDACRASSAQLICRYSGSPPPSDHAGFTVFAFITGGAHTQSFWHIQMKWTLWPYTGWQKSPYFHPGFVGMKYMSFR